MQWLPKMADAFLTDAIIGIAVKQKKTNGKSATLERYLSFFVKIATKYRRNEIY